MNKHSNSSLVDYVRISPNKSQSRLYPITTITIHCMVGQMSVEGLGSWFGKSSTGASSNYGIGADGRVGMYCEEKDRSWCTSDWRNDNRAVTIEVASDTTAPYAVKSVVYAKLIELVEDICRRNNIRELKWLNDPSLKYDYTRQNMTVHRWFANKACPGQYLMDRMGDIAKQVNQRLGEAKSSTPHAAPDSSCLYRVQVGAFSSSTNASKMEERLKRDGFDTYKVVADNLYKVQVGAFANRGNAEALSDQLVRKGYDTYITTKAGEAVAPVAPPKKTVTELAREVLEGKWGNGEDRRKRLEAAGHNYARVQQRVNEILAGR